MGRWLNGVPCKPGLQEVNIELVKKLLEGADLKDRQAVLSFDEMDIKKVYEYDHRNKQVFGPNKKLQVVIVRSLFSNWKQTIFFDFDKNMTLDLITSLVLECESRGIQIRGLTFDLGNKTLLSQVGFTSLNFKLQNPSDSSRFIFLFPDCPHLLKLWKNHCLDDGYSFPDNDGNYHHLTKQHFKNMIEQDGQELKLCPKLRTLHIDAKGSQRQRVYVAAQLFSDTTGKCMKFQGGNSLLVQSNAILTVDRWFDTMNSRTPFNAVPYRCGFGLKLQEQIQALDDMKKLVENMRFCGKENSETKLPFQRGILVSISSIKALYEAMTSLLPEISFLLTCRVNSDVSENKFTQIRGIGGDQTHPGPVTAINRMRCLSIIKNVKHMVRDPAVQLPEQQPQEAEEHRERFITEQIIHQPSDLQIEPENIEVKECQQAKNY